MKKILAFIAMISLCASTLVQADPIVTDSTSRSTTDSTSNSTTTVKSPPQLPLHPQLQLSIRMFVPLVYLAQPKLKF